MTLLEKYGPWALLVGGSEGIGEHLARKLGRAGINIVLVARKAGPLAACASKVRAECGVEVRTLELDIAGADMLDRIRAITDDLEIGLLVHNVGGGTPGGMIVDLPEEALLATVLANPVALTRLAHHFGKPMATRGHGGILVIGSMAGNAGCYLMGVYSASKAYNQILVEALWAELQPRGVDVLAIPIGAADTPARQRSGTVDSDLMPVALPEDVAQLALDHMAEGPVLVMPHDQAYFDAACTSSRRVAVENQRDLIQQMISAALGAG